MPNPCQHDSTCLQAHNNRGYHCLCHAGWRGYACERKYENIITLSVNNRYCLDKRRRFESIVFQILVKSNNYSSLIPVFNFTFV